MSRQRFTPPRRGRLEAESAARIASVGWRALRTSLVTLLAFVGAVPVWQPLNNVPTQPALQFLIFAVTHDECPAGSCTHTYFNLQGLVVDGATSTSALLRSNMIGEYR